MKARMTDGEQAETILDKPERKSYYKKKLLPRYLRITLRIGRRHPREGYLFCSQCSKAIFGIDYQDLLLSDDDIYGDRLVACDRCGWILVDSFGKCLLEGHHIMPTEIEYRSQYEEIMERFFGPEWDRGESPPPIISEDVLEESEVVADDNER